MNQTVGWVYPSAEAKAVHAFPGPDTRSLCGKYHHVEVLVGDLVPDDKVHPDTKRCATCEKKKAG